MTPTIESGQHSAHQADIHQSRFDDVNLADSTFKNVNMKGVRFEDANFSDASFENINFKNARLSNADYTGMTIDGIPLSELLAAHRAAT